MKTKIIKALACLIPIKKYRKRFRVMMSKELRDAAQNKLVYNKLINSENAVNLKMIDNPALKEPFSIGIITYNKRFEKFFKPLVESIRKSYDGEIIVCINGNHNETFDESYRKEILTFLAGYDNVFPMFFTCFRSLGKLWNNCLINSSNNNMLLLNDDIMVDNSFWKGLKSAIIQKEGYSFKLNNSWSHVLLNRAEVAKVGWLDERLLGIGYEDNDFEVRWKMMFGEDFHQVNNIPGLQNLSDKEDAIINQRVAPNKYSMFNKEFFYNKYRIEDGADYKQQIKDKTQYPYEEFFWERKCEI